jgi:hypothetical protein
LLLIILNDIGTVKININIKKLFNLQLLFIIIQLLTHFPTMATDSKTQLAELMPTSEHYHCNCCEDDIAIAWSGTQSRVDDNNIKIIGTMG